MTFPLARNELRPELLLEHVPGLKCRQRVERGSAHGERAAGAHTDTRVQAEGRPFPAPAPARMAVPGRRDRGPGPPLLPGTAVLILSAACYTRSSPGFAAWLLEHPPRRSGDGGRPEPFPVTPRPARVSALSRAGLSFSLPTPPMWSRSAACRSSWRSAFSSPRGRTVDDHVRPELRSSCPVLTPRSRTSRDCAAGRRPSP